MAVAFDAVGPGSSGSIVTGGHPDTGVTNSWSHTASGSNRAVVVGVAVGFEGSHDASVTVHTVTYDGVAMTSLGLRHTDDQTAGYVELFGLVNPPTGAKTVVASILSSAGDITSIVGGSISFTGVDQTTPFDTAVTAAGDNSSGTHPPTGSVMSTSGDLVVDVVGYGSALTGATGSLQWLGNGDNLSGAGNGAQSTYSGASSVTVQYNPTAKDWWGIVAVNINAASGGGGGISIGWSNFYTGGALQSLESYEGGSNGAALTTAPGGNTIFETKFTGSGSSAVFDSSTFADGSLSAKHVSDGAGGDASYMQKTVAPGSSVMYTRFAMLINSNPSASLLPCVAANAGGNADVRIDSGGKVALRDNTTAVGTTTSSVPLGTWFCIEYAVDAIGGTQSMKLYSDLEGTLQESLLNKTYSQGTLTNVRYGICQTLSTTVWIDAVAISYTNWVGPLIL